MNILPRLLLLLVALGSSLPALGQGPSVDRITGLSTSVAVKPPVKAVSSANLTLSGEQTVNGVAVVEGDRVLVKDQTDTVDNGIYIVDDQGWDRAQDFDGARDVVKGTLVVSNSGTSIYYRLTSADPITIGTSNITFEVISGAVTQSSLGQALNPTSSHETSESVTPADWAYRYGEADRYSTLADALKVSKGPFYPLTLAADTYSITAALAVDEPVVVQGVGINSGVTAGSIVSNITNDVTAFLVSGDSQRTVFRDFGVLHQAATKPAFQFLEEGAYGQFDNVVVDCNGVGFGGVLFGDEASLTAAELLAADANAWQGTTQNLRIDDCTEYNLRINSRGHSWDLGNASLRTSVNGAISLYVNAENVFVRGGQIGASGTGGKPMYWYNLRDSGLLAGGGSEGQRFENVDPGEYAIEIDGATQKWSALTFNKIGANLTSGVTGTVIKFGRCEFCWLTYPQIETPTGGGTLAEWGENSADCGILVDLDAARAPVTVHASATRPVKVVYGAIPAASVTNITTAANLTTILRDGVPELPPGFVPVHNGTGWNYWLVTLADDAASSFTLPAVGAALVRSRVTVLSDGGVTFAGTAFVDADSGGAAISAQGVGADFNTTTGALAGTTGSDVKVTLSGHTDGKIYLENRSGASRDFTVLIEPVLSGTAIFDVENYLFRIEEPANDGSWLETRAA